MGFDSIPRVCFEVEKVIGVSSDGSYLVQWAPSWVNKFHLVGCEHLIQEFLQQQKIQQTQQKTQQPQQQQQQQQQRQQQQPQQQPQEADQYEIHVLLPDTITDSHHTDNLNYNESIPPDMDANDFSAEDLYMNSYDNNVSDPICNISIQDDNDDNGKGHDEVQNVHAVVVEIADSDDEEDGENSQTNDSCTLEDTVNQNLPNIISQSQLKATEDQRKAQNVEECLVCGQKVLRKHFRKHMRTHNIAQPWLCRYCSRGFATRMSLESHLRTHTGDKPFSCDVCYKTFAHKKSLIVHKQTHAGIKPYICRKCGKAFSQMTNLKNYHMPRCKAGDDGGGGSDDRGDGACGGDGGGGVGSVSASSNTDTVV